MNLRIQDSRAPMEGACTRTFGKPLPILVDLRFSNHKTLSLRKSNTSNTVSSMRMSDIGFTSSHITVMDGRSKSEGSKYTSYNYSEHYRRTIRKTHSFEAGDPLPTLVISLYNNLHAVSMADKCKEWYSRCQEIRIILSRHLS